MKYFIVLFFLIVVAIGCVSDRSSENLYINGTWDVIEAYRSDVKTETLNNAFFHFTHDSISTNILGDTVSTALEIDGRKLFQGGIFPIQYKIERFDKDTLVLSAKIRKYSFLFKTLSRKQMEVNDEK